MLLGRKLEEDVYAACDGKYVGCEDGAYDRCIEDLARHVRGGLRQEKAYARLEIGGIPVLLYGKIDAIRRNWIYDIKRTGSYEIGKFTGSIQHPLYMFCSGVHNFRYLVSDGRSVWTEDYVFDEDMRNWMFGEIADMLERILADRELGPAYHAHWTAKQDREAA